MQNATLPVDWLGFTATEQNKSVRLEWSTTAEQHTKEFIVQHSMNGRDWKNIGRVPAANSNEVSHYSFVHVFPNDGVNYYRIKQTDLDGHSSVSEIRLITFMGSDDLFAVLRNPAMNGVIELKIARGSVHSLYGSDGRLFYQKRVVAGMVNISVQEFSKGIYSLEAPDILEKSF